MQQQISSKPDEKKKKKKEKAKFILNILKYTLIKNFKLQILIMRCDTFGNPPLSEGQVRTQNF